jgi:hypothetical protein
MKRLIVVAVIAALSAGAGPVSAQTKTRTGTPPAVDRSKALVATPALDPFVAVAAIPAETARVIADQVGAAIPLPAGGTFNGVRWEVAGGVFSRTEIAAVLQYNASCQWLRAWRDGRETATSEQVLADVPSWPAWRFAETSAVLGKVAADVRAGGGESASAVLADCDASHEREATYSAARGLAPSR